MSYITEEAIIEAVDDPFATRADVAAVYALPLVYEQHAVDWRVVNTKILERWKPSGLEWIKREAWRLATSHPHAPNTEKEPE